MAQYIKQGNIFGRIGTGIGKGLSEQIPKEIERNRLASGLKNLNNQKDLSPQEYFTQAIGIPGVIDRPQLVQSLENFGRQKAIMESTRQNEQNYNDQLRNSNVPIQNNPQNPSAYNSATTKEGVQSTLNPIIPPSGEEIESRARKRVADEPYIYPTLESARAAENSIVAANQAQSQAKINKRNLEQSVQKEIEQELSKEIANRGVKIPGKFASRLQNKAVEAVANGEMTESEAGKHFGGEAEEISKDFSKLRGWGGIDLITNSAKDLFSSIRNIREKYPERSDRSIIAQEMVGENDVSPRFAYAQMIPVSENKSLNEELKSIPDIRSNISKVAGLGGALGFPLLKGIKSKDSAEKTLKLAPKLLKAMGSTGSPLSVGYELEKKGYDPDTWKEYLLDHKGEMTGDQYEELGLTQKGFMGWLNDLWFSSFTGIK